MAYFKILVIAGEYRTYMVEARDQEEAEAFLRNEPSNYSYEVGSDDEDPPEIIETWEAG